MDNATRFLNAFSIIEQRCREITNEDRTAKFYLVLRNAAKVNEIIRRYQIDLQDYSELRNALVHDRSDSGEVIAQPIDEVTNHIEKIAAMLNKPESLKNHFLKSVKTCGTSDRVIEVYARMKQLGTSKMPIYDQNEFKGLLTLEMIADWSVLNRKNMPDPTVDEVFNPQFKSEKVYFMKKDASILEALELFEKAMYQGVNLLAIMITETGKRNEKLLGIVTVADLPKIINLINN